MYTYHKRQVHQSHQHSLFLDHSTNEQEYSVLMYNETHCLCKSLRLEEKKTPMYDFFLLPVQLILSCFWVCVMLKHKNMLGKRSFSSLFANSSLYKLVWTPYAKHGFDTLLTYTYHLINRICSASSIAHNNCKYVLYLYSSLVHKKMSTVQCTNFFSTQSRWQETTCGSLLIPSVVTDSTLYPLMISRYQKGP